MVAFRRTPTLGMLGDDSATLLNIGFSPTQVSQITSAHASGGLSDAGYQALVSGFISPDDLSGFLDADPGAPTVNPPTPGSNTSVQVNPGITNAGQLISTSPAPRVNFTAPSSVSTFFNSSSLISGFPNWAVLFGSIAFFALIGGRRGKR